MVFLDFHLVGNRVRINVYGLVQHKVGSVLGKVGLVRTIPESFRGPKNTGRSRLRRHFYQQRVSRQLDGEGRFIMKSTSHIAVPSTRLHFGSAGTEECIVGANSECGRERKRVCSLGNLGMLQSMELHLSALPRDRAKIAVEPVQCLFHQRLRDRHEVPGVEQHVAFVVYGRPQ
jgi:hypothetical protein